MNPFEIWKIYKAQKQEIYNLNRKIELQNRDIVEIIKVVSDIKLQYQCFWAATKELYPEFYPVIADFSTNKFQTIKHNQQASYNSIKRDYVMGLPTFYNCRCSSIKQPPELNLIGGSMSNEEYCLREGIIND